MRGVRGGDPAIALVADDRYLKMSVGLKGGLEVMGLNVAQYASMAALAENGASFDHMIVLAAVDEPWESGSSTQSGTASRQKRAERLARHISPSPRPDDPPNWHAALDLLSRLCALKISTFEIIPDEGAGFHVRDIALAEGEEILGRFDTPSAREIIKALTELCVVTGALSDALEERRFLLRLGREVVEVTISAPSESECPRLSVVLRPLKASDMQSNFSAPRHLEAPAYEPSDDEDLTGSYIQRIVTTIHQQAIRDGAHRLILTPGRVGIEVDYSIGDYDFEVMSIPDSHRDLFIQSLRIMAGLYTANRKLVQRGRYNLRVDGREHHLEVTIIPTDEGDRAEIILAPELLAANAQSAEAVVPHELVLGGKTVLLLGNSEPTASLWASWKKCGVRRVITTAGLLDTPSLLLFALSFYRSLVRQGDERAAFKKAKSAVFTGEEVRLLEEGV